MVIIFYKYYTVENVLHFLTLVAYNPSYRHIYHVSVLKESLQENHEKFMLFFTKPTYRCKMPISLPPPRWYDHVTEFFMNKNPINVP